MIRDIFPAWLETLNCIITTVSQETIKVGILLFAHIWLLWTV